MTQLKTQCAISATTINATQHRQDINRLLAIVVVDILVVVLRIMRDPRRRKIIPFHHPVPLTRVLTHLMTFKISSEELPFIVNIFYDIPHL